MSSVVFFVARALSKITGCRSTFIKYGYLERHIIRGDHDIEPDRTITCDYAISLYIDSNEGSGIANSELDEVKEAVNNATLKTITVQGKDKTESVGFALRKVI